MIDSKSREQFDFCIQLVHLPFLLRFETLEINEKMLTFNKLISIVLIKEEIFKHMNLSDLESFRLVCEDFKLLVENFKLETLYVTKSLIPRKLAAANSEDEQFKLSLIFSPYSERSLLSMESYKLYRLAYTVRRLICEKDRLDELCFDLEKFVNQFFCLNHLKLNGYIIGKQCRFQLPQLEKLFVGDLWVFDSSVELVTPFLSRIETFSIFGRNRFRFEYPEKVKFLDTATFSPEAFDFVNLEVLILLELEDEVNTILTKFKKLNTLEVKKSTSNWLSGELGRIKENLCRGIKKIESWSGSRLVKIILFNRHIKSINDLDEIV